VGRGHLDIVLRGMVLGAIFAWVYGYFLRHRDRWWVVVSYIWLYVLSYQAIRASSFYLLGPFVQTLLPSLLIVKIGSTMFGAGTPKMQVPRIRRPVTG
jgi:hypothetical protein